MQPISVVGMFCEDIREEKSGVVSLIGVMPDNANVTEAPKAGQALMVPKLALYVRVHFHPSQRPDSIDMSLTAPDGTAIPLGSVEPTVIEHASTVAKQKNAPIAGIVVRAQLSPFPLKSIGRLVAELVIDGSKYVAAAVNFDVGVSSPSPGMETHHEVVHRL